LPYLRYRIGGPQVIHQTIDGEVVAINLQSGRYYSLRGSAAALWRAIERRPDRAGLLAEMRAGYAGTSDEPIDRFLAELTEEGLLVAETVAHEEPPDAAVPAADGRPAFEPPRLEKFTDLSQMLLLDPIHDVDEAGGWPIPKPGPAAP
jgi:hypothetical protein